MYLYIYMCVYIYIFIYKACVAPTVEDPNVFAEGSAWRDGEGERNRLPVLVPASYHCGEAVGGGGGGGGGGGAENPPPLFGRGCWGGGGGGGGGGGKVDNPEI